MTTTRRALAAPAVVAAVVVAALAVGDHGTGPPTAPEAPEASKAPDEARIVTAEEFCEAFGTLALARESHLTAASPATVVGLRSAAAALRDLAVGTALSDSEAAGVAYVVDAFLALEDDATAQDVVAADDLATVSDEAHADALAAYVGDSCRQPGLSEAE